MNLITESQKHSPNISKENLNNKNKCPHRTNIKKMESINLCSRGIRVRQDHTKYKDS